MIYNVTLVRNFTAKEKLRGSRNLTVTSTDIFSAVIGAISDLRSHPNLDPEEMAIEIRVSANPTVILKENP